MSFVARRAANARRAEYKMAGGDEHLPPGRPQPYPVQQPGGPPAGSVDPKTRLPVLGDPGFVPGMTIPQRKGQGASFKPHASRRASSRAAAPSSTRQATGGALPDGVAHDLGTALGKVLGPVVAQHFMNQANEALHGQLRAQGIVQ